jgi:hypothetical protein
MAARRGGPGPQAATAAGARETALIDNPFENRAGSTVGPGIDYLPVTPDDLADFEDVAVALYVETGGQIRFLSVKGNERTVTLPNFGYLLCGVRRVNATGTTATGIHAIVVT